MINSERGQALFSTYTLGLRLLYKTEQAQIFMSLPRKIHNNQTVMSA